MHYLRFKSWFFIRFMLSKTHALVLHSFKLGDSKFIVEVLTEVHGRVSFITNIAKSKKGAQQRMLFQPLTLLEITFDYRSTQNLQKLKEARIAVPLHQISFDPYKCSIAFFLAEFLFHATKKESHNTLLYKYIESSVMWLNETSQQFANFHIVFMLKLSKFIGFYPNLDSYTKGCLFNLRTACFEFLMPAHSDVLTMNEAESMYHLLRLNYDTMHHFAMSHEERNHCTELILKYYKLHLPSFPPLKSLSVLQDVMRT